MNIAPYIDHTLLKPNATISEIEKLCQEAMEYGFATVCVNPIWVADCQSILQLSLVDICTVIGFPLGSNTSAVKSYEAIKAIEAGASEIDMVINIGALKSSLPARVEDDINLVRQSTMNSTLKVIIETCLLTDAEKELACTFAKNCGADFVKTSTGFSTGGATVEDIKLIRKVIGPNMGIKASGGIRDLKTAQAMMYAGANRLGCSASVAIVSEDNPVV
ncbi:deoxyribose-phosphate aldolase [Candidatus Falkowbacteria bacterium]|uniref:Deoxyribose-phosphate aldolase n=1 Tax=Candidatus Buchananbacteria bacterium CG10_big_fil_rev_8_21_14_0_10_33_19 TaxID=1974525 RepID=A0A2H0W542_9BACT|nr:deoxyribose-phosphate aldolase [Candidatus Falkowbacteria bacterium]PIS06459.1 MAG: deoxyribose-phosphate aldolase [Candidatus Buchananbacteria bacterium CG10_big_fil_rev_8_21_14_0_10_33_19]